MDQYLLYDIHINHVCRKVNGILLFLNRIKDRLDKETRIMVVKALALSIIDYCFKIWGMTTKEQLSRIQKLQNFAAKIADGNARKFDHATPILKELNWLKIEEKILYDICIFTYKVCNQLLPNWLFTFPRVRDISARSTRQVNDLFVPRTTTDIGANQITVIGPKVWNTIPSTVKNVSTVHIFKKKMKKYFLET